MLVGLLIATGVLATRNAIPQTSMAAKVAKAAKQPAATPPPEAPQASPAPAASSQAIPLPQIADQAEELDTRLDEISNRLRQKQDLLAPVQSTGNHAEQIKERALGIDAFLRTSPGALQIRDEAVYWRALSHQSAEERRLLTGRADELQKEIGFLDLEMARWQATREQIHDITGIEVVAARVQQEIDAIRAVRAQAQEQLNRVLTLQNGLSQTSRQVSESLAKLTDAEILLRGHFFERDSEPLWSLRALKKDELPIRTLLRRSADKDAATAGEFLRADALALAVIPLIYILSAFGILKLRRYLAAGHGWPALAPETEKILARPYSVALAAALLVTIPQLDAVPVSITLFYYMLWLVLVFRLAPIFIVGEFRSLLYPVLVFNVLELIRVATPLSPMVNRLLLTMILAGASGVFGWIAHRLWLRKPYLAQGTMLFRQLGLALGLLLLVLAFFANAFGYVALSHVLGIGTLISGLLVIALYCIARTALQLLTIYLLSPRAAATFPDQLRQRIALWSRRLLIAAAVYLLWVHSELYGYLLRDGLTSAWSDAMAYSFGLGKAEFTLGGIVGVVSIVVVGYLLVKSFSSLLRAVLVARFPIQRGLPYAISKVTYYCLMLLVFAAAVARAGVDLNKFTVITGALGIGIGFGLQNIVNNFASGLILLFERPIRVGDIVEVNNLSGTVKRIGARSSTLATAQGAEVILPNNNLIANQVINWTLTSPWRRVEIPVGVAYGSDPEGVLRLLVAAAASHPEVLPYPSPAAFFLGFGDSALNFELRFWAQGQDTWFQVKSDVSIAVSQALREANIEVPFPQRDLHLRSMDASIAPAGDAAQMLATATNPGKPTKLPTDDAKTAQSPVAG